MQVIPFNFDKYQVRTVLNSETGEVLFVGKDVCVALGYSNHNDAMTKHCKGVAKRYPLQTTGGIQELRVLTEADVLRLAINSQLPSAEPFERWVFEDVLPTIRKTGSYSMPTAQPTHAISKNQDAVAAIMMIGGAMASWPGVRHGIVQSATLNTIELVTGYPTEAFLRALPALESTEVIGSMNPTAIGKRIGKSAAWVNATLRGVLGFQVKNERGKWVLTVAGQKYGESLPHTRHGHSGFQILWRESVIDLF